MKKIFLLLLLNVMALCGFSQLPGQVRGKVLTINNQPAVAATVSLHRIKDSVMVKLALTDDKGEFKIDCQKTGEHFLKVSMTGHKTYFSAPVIINETNAQILFPDVTLELGAEATLSEVKVSVKRPLIEQRADKTIVNVEASISTAGSTALEVLERLPGVIVDQNGQVSIKGKQGATVMIDGKPTYMSATDLANYLRSLPASTMDNIEIMTNPPAKYDASGNSGIINIRLKKNKAKGFNGSASASFAQAKYWRNNESLNLNYRNGKFNFFTNYSYYNWSGFNDLYVKRNFFKAGSRDEVETIFEQDSYNKMRYPGHTLKAGVDYFLSKKTTLGVVFNGFWENGNDEGDNQSRIMDAYGNINTIIESEFINLQKNKNLGGNVNFKHTFDSTGKELTIDADYIQYKMTTTQDFTNKFYDVDGKPMRPDLLVKGDLPSVVDIYSGKADYVHPMKKSWKLETGLKYSYVKSDNDARYYNYVEPEWVQNENLSNHFVYEEQISAAYLNASKQWKKWSAQAGLRIEHTEADGKQYVNDSTFSRSYTNIFPTLYLTYSLNEKNQFTGSLGRRIERPAYQDLNPFRYFLDPYTYQQGNPFLQPQFSNNVELSHTYNGKLTSSVSFSKTYDIMTETMNQIDSDTITYVYKANVGTADNLSFSVSYNADMKKWWTLSLYGQIFYSHFYGPLNGGYLDNDAWTGMVNFNNQFKFGKGWSGELGGWGRTSGIEGQITINPMAAVNAGIQKNVLKDKGSVKVSVSDLFYTQKFEGGFYYENIDVQVKQSRMTRVAKITFTYRFGKNGFEQRQRRSAADEESSRVKKSGS